MSVLFVVESLGIGGAEVFLAALAPALQARGCKVAVAHLFGPDTLASSIASAGIPVYNLKARKHRFIESAWKIASLVRSEKFDVVHAHLFHAALPVAISRIFGRGSPAIVTFHNTGYEAYPPHGTLKRLRRHLDGVMTRWGFVQWLAVSQAAADAATSHLKLPSIAVIHNGIDFKSINAVFGHSRDAVLGRYGLSPDLTYVVMPGRLVWEKGHQVFLKAWPIIRDAAPWVFGLIVGDGPLRNEIQREIGRGSHGANLRLIPGLSPADLLALMYACDVVAIPSLSEGWPLLLAEAMALEKPIACSGAGGIREVLGEEGNALVVPAGDPLALANGLVSLLSRPDFAAQLARRARAHAQRHFSIDSVAEKHLEIYSEIAAVSL